jgi:hypothetical protein
VERLGWRSTFLAFWRVSKGALVAVATEISFDLKNKRKAAIAANRSDRAVKHKMTGSVESDSTTDMIAPAAEAGRDRNVERLPRQQGTAEGAARPQASPQLQHSDRKSKIHFGGLESQASNSRVVGSDSYSLTNSIFSN